MTASNGRSIDSLATTILLASIVLAGIWFWERHQSDRLLQANVAAQDYSRDHLSAGCDAFASGAGGRTLVIRCDSASTVEMKNALAPERASAFESFLLVAGSGERLSCKRAEPLVCEPVEGH